MATVVNEKSKTITMRNCIKVDNAPVKYQEITINSDSPKNITFNTYFANNDAKEIYKENREEIRKIEDNFEDEAYLLQDSLLSE